MMVAVRVVVRHWTRRMMRSVSTQRVQVESGKATIIIVAATIPIQPLWEDVGVVPPESRTITIEPLEEDVGRKEAEIVEFCRAVCARVSVYASLKADWTRRSKMPARTRCSRH